MTPERFRQIEELYRAAREGTPHEREALLARADPDLRRHLESLLLETEGSKSLDLPAIRNASFLPQHEALTTAAPTGAAPGVCLGPYRIESKLGEGGMGEVFRAIDTRLDRVVAIKTNREQFNPRFEREARAISSLNHPNICTLFDVGPNYLVMELVEGETLAARLKQGVVPMQTALLYAAQIAAALIEAHGKGIVHRDLKPGNIMIGRTGIKVLDFGLARSVQDETVTASRMIVGTPAYMAPEQREGLRADARTDIYSFGCVIYEMLTGERVSIPRRRIPARRLETIVSRCLEQDAARRWQSAAELQQALASVPATVRKANRELSPTASIPAQPAHKPTRKNKIVLGEFENKSGEAAFDGILRDGLSLQLEQSPFLALVPEQQVRQILRLMHRPSDTRLTPDVAQEICERAGGTAFLDGSITSLGTRYVLSLRARSCQTGDILGNEQVEAARKEEVLKALGRITGQLRARLGESLARLDEHPKPLEQVTTSSLEALKAYSAGRAAVFTRGSAAAMPHMERAIAIDPQFAMAQADLGFFFWNMGQTDLGIGYTLRAYELRERVSERERFFILFLYDRQVTGNLHKELATIEAWAHTFPTDWQAWGVLGGWGTRGTGQYARGIQASEECLRISPNLPFPYESLAVHKTSLGRFTEAAAALRTAAELGMEIPNFLVGRYYLAFLEADEAGARREIDRARGSREAEDQMSHHQALVLAQSGQMRNARTMWRQAIELAQQNGYPGKAAIYQAAAAVCEGYFGNLAAAKDRAQSALELAKGRDVEYAAAFALSLSGDEAGVQILANELARQFPEDTPVQFEYLPILRALSALSKKAPLEAIEHLQTALPYDLAMPGTAFFAKFGGLYTVYVRGLAYLEAGRGPEAAAEFQKVLDHRGIVLADPIGALAHLQLGRARALAGNREGSANAYRDFLTLWKDADADIPVLKQATIEYAEL